VLNEGVANDVRVRKSRSADLHRDQHHLRYCDASGHQRSLVGIARHLRRAVVGCQGAMGQTVNKRPELQHFQLQDSGALIAARAHALPRG
jgi:hypothetical protein